MRTASVEEARARLGDLVDRARLAGEPTLITRYGREAAVVVSADWYRLAEDCLATDGRADADAAEPPEGIRNGG
jgi:prevent-host-death family protein